MNDDLKKALDKMAKKSDFMIGNPNTFKKMEEMGLPIESKRVTNTEYLNNLFKEKRRFAEEAINDLPILDPNIANPTAKALYQEVKESFVLGIPGAAITLSIILLEYSCRYNLFIHKKKTNPKAGWGKLEKMTFSETIKALRKAKIIDDNEKLALLDFGSNIRNNYLHYNIRKLLKNMFVSELPKIDIATGKITILKDVIVKDCPMVWFSAKRANDAHLIDDILMFCMNWVNKLL